MWPFHDDKQNGSGWWLFGGAAIANAAEKLPVSLYQAQSNKYKYKLKNLNPEHRAQLAKELEKYGVALNHIHGVYAPAAALDLESVLPYMKKIYSMSRPEQISPVIEHTLKPFYSGKAVWPQIEDAFINSKTDKELVSNIRQILGLSDNIKYIINIPEHELQYMPEVFAHEFGHTRNFESMRKIHKKLPKLYTTYRGLATMVNGVLLPLAGIYAFGDTLFNFNNPNFENTLANVALGTGLTMLPVATEEITASVRGMSHLKNLLKHHPAAAEIAKIRKPRFIKSLIGIPTYLAPLITAGGLYAYLHNK